MMQESSPTSVLVDTGSIRMAPQLTLMYREYKANIIYMLEFWLYIYLKAFESVYAHEQVTKSCPCVI